MYIEIIVTFCPGLYTSEAEGGHKKIIKAYFEN